MTVYRDAAMVLRQLHEEFVPETLSESSSARVMLRMRDYESELRNEGRARGQAAVRQQDERLRKGITRESIAADAREVLGDIPEIKALERSSEWAAKEALMKAAMAAREGLSFSDPKYSALRRLQRDLLNMIEPGEEKEPDDLRRSEKEWAEGQIKQMREHGQAAEKLIKQAVGRIDTWSGGEVTLIPRRSQSEYGLESQVTSFDVIVGRRNAGFTLFMSEDGRAVDSVEDVLDAGDPDFFHDPHAQMNYFDLVRELEHPGSTRKLGKKVTLWTARPTKDRHLYQGAKHIPTNIYLTTDKHRAGGIAHDLGSGEIRDLWKVVIHEKYLMQTLDAGRIRDYQTIGKKTVPVVRISLVAEGESDTSVALDRDVLAESSLEENTRAVLHWVKQKYGAAKAMAHREFLAMVRKDPEAHRRKMMQDKKYHRMHKWHDALMRKTRRPGWVRRHVREWLDERDPGQAFMDLPFELRVTEKSNPASMKVQTLIFSKDSFSRQSAVKWAKKHGFKATKVDEKENTYRIRQRDPDEFGTFRTIAFKPGLKAVVART